MIKIETTRDLHIVVDTICMLARDARLQGNREALAFVGSYLEGLVPADKLDGFREELRAIKPAATVRNAQGGVDAPPAAPRKAPNMPAMSRMATTLANVPI